MQLSRTLGGYCNIVHGKEFPMNAIILRLDNGTEFICTNFRQSRKKPLKVYCYIPTEKKWVITFLKGNYKEIMWNYYRKHQRKNKSKVNYAQMMKHDRKHKSGGGGSRIYNGSITDYECAKNPLHDFRKVYN